MHLTCEIDNFDDAFALLSSSKHVNTAAVFVHGFLGDAEATWCDFQSLIEESAEWRGVDLYFFGYDSFNNSVSTSANNLRDFLSFVEEREVQRLVPDRFFAEVGRLASDRETPLEKLASYSQLLLIGHSLGGLVIRALIRADNKLERKPKTSLSRLLRKATVRLFAPAISGARPAGLRGIALQLGGIGSLGRLVLGGSPSYQEMCQGSQLLRIIEKDTTEMAERYRHRTALRADVIWAERDDIVSDIEYRHDRVHERPPGTNHVTVCKPRREYRLPLEYVIDGVSR